MAKWKPDDVLMALLIGSVVLVIGGVLFLAALSEQAEWDYKVALITTCGG